MSFNTPLGLNFLNFAPFTHRIPCAVKPLSPSGPYIPTCSLCACCLLSFPPSNLLGGGNPTHQISPTHHLWSSPWLFALTVDRTLLTLRTVTSSQRYFCNFSQCGLQCVMHTINMEVWRASGISSSHLTVN